MNVYDFDGTIYYDDCTADFFKFCIKRNPKTLLTLFPTGIAGVLYGLKIISRKSFKAKFYRFLRHIPDIDAAAEEFWRKNAQKIKAWYLEQKRDDDIIISASSEFLLTPICEKLGVRLIASKVDKHTGELLGENCRDEEKIKRLYAQFPDAVIDEFYSDSHADDPLAAIAKKAFWVEGDKILGWKK